MDQRDDGPDRETKTDEQLVAGERIVDPPKTIPAVPSACAITPPTVNVDAKHLTTHDAPASQSEQESNNVPIERIKRGEQWMISLTLIIAAATVANVIVFYCESRSTSEQITKLTEEAGRIVGSMNHALSDSRVAIGRAFDANKQTLEASSKQSRSALEAQYKDSSLGSKGLGRTFYTTAAQAHRNTARSTSTHVICCP